MFKVNNKGTGTTGALQKAIATVVGSFTFDIRNTCFKNSLDRCFGIELSVYWKKWKKKLEKNPNFS